MNNLDNLQAIRILDKSNTLASISSLPDQCRQAWMESAQTDFPPDYQNIKNIVVSGMGGSAFGARIVKSLYDGAETTKIPLEFINGYSLPGYVDNSTLVILSSYSGQTEETLVTAKQAKDKKAKIAGITSGGDLAQFLLSGNYPSYIFTPIYNPCGQPRIGIGYMVMGLLGLLASIKRVPVNHQEIDTLVAFLKKQNTYYYINITSLNNYAKQWAKKLKDKIPIFIVADYLKEPAHAVRNIFHETAKQFTLHFTIPELNHHLLEGLSYPSDIRQLITFIFIDTAIYGSKNKIRLSLTKEIVHNNSFNYETITFTGKTPLTVAMEFIQLGTWVAFYLAMIHNVDPARIPYVTNFKDKLRRVKQ